MTINPQRDTDILLKRIEENPSRPYQSAILLPLNTAVFVLTLIGLFLISVTGGFVSNSNITIFIIVSSLLINFAVYLFDRWGHTQTASQIFCIWVNLGIVAFVYLNFAKGEQEQGVIFAALQGMCVLLASILLQGRYPFIYAIVNVIALCMAIYYGLQRIDFTNIVGQIIAFATPLGFYYFIIAMIAWLYQRALLRSANELRKARERILRDEVLFRDVEVAHKLQQQLLPPPPDLPNLMIAARALPARETGGDFYDFIQLDDKHLALIIGDVTGKSIPAALGMAMARSILRSEARLEFSPAETLARANQTLCAEPAVRQVLTLMYLVLNLETLEIRLVNAGSPYPILLRNGEAREIEIVGLPLGSWPNVQYEEMRIQLQNGDLLVLASDGIAEERGHSRELFGFERIAKVVAHTGHHGPQYMIDTLLTSIEAFRTHSEQSDDMTIVACQIGELPRPPSTFSQAPYQYEAPPQVEVVRDVSKVSF